MAERMPHRSPIFWKFVLKRQETRKAKVVVTINVGWSDHDICFAVRMRNDMRRASGIQGRNTPVISYRRPWSQWRDIRESCKLAADNKVDWSDF